MRHLLAGFCLDFDSISIEIIIIPEKNMVGDEIFTKCPNPLPLPILAEFLEKHILQKSQ